MKNFFYIFSVVKIIVLLISKPIFADPINAWEIASLTVVSVLPTWPGYDKPGFGAPPGTAPEGTGIMVESDGLILTAARVISKATDVKVRDIKGELFSAKIIKNSISTDLALLKTELELRPITIETEKPKIGSSACLISNSFGLNIGITCGVISATGLSNIGFNEIEDFLQTDAAANPGSSGGALVNLNGELLGMMSGIFTKNTDTNAGVNFAISSCLLYTSPSPRDATLSRMPSSA